MGTTSVKKGALPFIHPDHMPDRYCLTGVGACMEPLIPDGALIAFDKRETPKKGDIVCLTFTRAMALKQGLPGMVKILAMDLMPGFDTFLAFEMLNPRRTISFWSSDILAIHKCIGLPEKRADGTAWLRLPKAEA